MNTGNNLVYLIVSAFLGLMAVSGFFGRSNIAKLDVALSLPEEIYAARSFPVKVTVMNRRRIAPAFLIKVQVDDREALFPFVPAGGTESRYVEVYFPRRGRYRTGRLYLSSVYPFNFFVRYRTIPGAYEAVVFPQAGECGLYSVFENGQAQGGDSGTDHLGYEGELLSVRAYASGDPLKYIHWKSSAKTGELKTKEFSTVAHQPVTIDFEHMTPAAVEERISCATYVILKAFRDNVPVGMKINGTVFKPGLSNAHKRRMLRELALYGPDDRHRSDS